MGVYVTSKNVQQVPDAGKFPSRSLEKMLKIYFSYFEIANINFV